MVPSFLGMEGGQQQHASEHSDGGEQQTIYCPHHPILKNTVVTIAPFYAARASYWSAADFGAINSA